MKKFEQNSYQALNPNIDEKKYLIFTKEISPCWWRNNSYRRFCVLFLSFWKRTYLADSNICFNNFKSITYLLDQLFFSFLYHKWHFNGRTYIGKGQIVSKSAENAKIGMRQSKNREPNYIIILEVLRIDIYYFI